MHRSKVLSNIRLDDSKAYKNEYFRKCTFYLNNNNTVYYVYQFL